MYIAGELGGAFPGELSNVKGTGNTSGVTFGDFKITNSFVYGGKLGYFLESYNWLGFEVEAFSTTPHIKEQTVQVRPSGTSKQRDAELRVTVVAANLVMRYPGQIWQPYVGGGPALIYAKGTSAQSDSSTGVGLNFLSGLRVMVIQHFAVLAEYKYVGATFEFKNAFGPGFGVEEDYNASHVVAGVSYHF